MIKYSMVKESGINKSRIVKLLITVALMACIGLLHAQDAGNDQMQSNIPKDTKQTRIAAKKQKEREKKAEKERKEMLKQHMKDQTPEVRKRMKRDAKRANRNNEHKGDGFFYKLFHHKKRGKATGTAPPAAQ